MTKPGRPPSRKLPTLYHARRCKTLCDCLATDQDLEVLAEAWLGYVPPKDEIVKLLAENALEHLHKELETL